jgi:hypothetical protein
MAEDLPHHEALERRCRWYETGSRKPVSEMDPDVEGHLSLISFHNLTWNHNGASANARDRCGSRIN